MRHAEVIAPARVTLIALKLTNFGEPYKKLFDQTDLNGSEVFAAYSHDNFSNPFQLADEQLYKRMGWWFELFKDVVRESGRGTDDKGRLNVSYVSHATTQWEKSHNVWMPESGYWVPTEDGVFVPGTLVPFETVESKKIAMSRLEAKGIPKEQASYFYRLHNYIRDERAVERNFLADPSYGLFNIFATGPLHYSGSARVASRPVYKPSSSKLRIVMKLKVA